MCWGDNGGGQLGFITEKYYSSIPMDVSNFSSGVKAIAAGHGYTCALTMDGGVKCWGDDHTGISGNLTPTMAPVPRSVNGLSSGVVSIAAGSFHTCVLTTGGGVKCWGWNNQGQLGDGTTRDSGDPVNVRGLSSGVVGIAAGGFYTCALTQGGGVKCWGRNSYGELGNGTTADSGIPQDVKGLSEGVVAITAGVYHACALTSKGSVKCWGWNTVGPTGEGTMEERSVPVEIEGLSNGVIAIAAGGGHACALTRAGGVKCWGDNTFGQLGDGTNNKSDIPVNATGLSGGIAAIDTGDSHTCAITSTGGVLCWGGNQYGQLGDGTKKYRNVPVNVVR
jgi:alpha-tubulin suppressor-like RCC1 family protein